MMFISRADERVGCAGGTRRHPCLLLQLASTARISSRSATSRSRSPSASSVAFSLSPSLSGLAGNPWRTQSWRAMALAL